MAWYEPDHYLVVHDVKGTTGHLGRLRIQQGKPCYETVTLAWQAATPKSSSDAPPNQTQELPPTDLESVCWLPGTQGELLLAESGQRNGPRRLFRVRLIGLVAEVVGKCELEPWVEQQNIEGLACYQASGSDAGSSWLIVLGERGGRGEGHDSATLRWAWLDQESGSGACPSRWGPPLKGIHLEHPWESCPEGDLRQLSDLHFDRQGTLWASGGFEPKDPDCSTISSSARSEAATCPPKTFFSSVYAVGKVNTSGSGTVDEAAPLVLEKTFRPTLNLWGRRIEGLSAPPDGADFKSLGIATEEEDCGGAWCAVSTSATPGSAGTVLTGCGVVSWGRG